MSQVSYKERTKTIMSTKNWTSKVRIWKFLNNAHEAFLLTNGEISLKNFNIQDKMHVAILSEVEKSTYLFLSTLPLHWQIYCGIFTCTVTHQILNRPIFEWSFFGHFLGPVFKW
jgi:hypothetical protein